MYIAAASAWLLWIICALSGVDYHFLNILLGFVLLLTMTTIKDHHELFP